MDIQVSGKPVKLMQKQLTAVDHDELVSLCCGHKNGTSVVVDDEVQFEEYGKDEGRVSVLLDLYLPSSPHIDYWEKTFCKIYDAMVHCSTRWLK